MRPWTLFGGLTLLLLVTLLCAGATLIPSMSAPVAETPAGGIWIPRPGVTWQWQIDGAPIDMEVEAEVFDIDLFAADKKTVAALHARGKRVICYVDVGSWEDFRPDQGDFPPEIIGKVYEGFPNKRWLDIRRLDLLGPLMEARMDLCRNKGFDGLEPDNIGGYQVDSGFPLTLEDQLTYNRWLAEQAHARGLSIGLKNSPELVSELLPDFDWALTESCYEYEWCPQMLPFIADNKAVLMTEYVESGLTLDDFCADAKKWNFSPILKNLPLDAYRETCP
jgi:hypothetical protein